MESENINAILNGIQVAVFDSIEENFHTPMPEIYPLLLCPIHQSQGHSREEFPKQLPRLKLSLEYNYPKYDFLSDIKLRPLFKMSLNTNESIFIHDGTMTFSYLMSVRQFLLLIELLYSKKPLNEMILLIGQLTLSFLYTPYSITEALSIDGKNGGDDEKKYTIGQGRSVSKLLERISVANRVLLSEKRLTLERKDFSGLSPNIKKILYSGRLTPFMLYLEILGRPSLLATVERQFNDSIRRWLREGVVQSVQLVASSWRTYMEKKLFKETIFATEEKEAETRWKKKFHLIIPDSASSMEWMKRVRQFVHREKKLQEVCHVDDCVLSMIPSHKQLYNGHHLSIVSLDDRNNIMGYVTATLYKIDLTKFPLNSQPEYDEDSEVNAWYDFYNLVGRRLEEGRDKSLFNFAFIDGLYLGVEQRGNNLASLLIYYLLFFFRSAAKELGLLAIGSNAAAFPTMKLLESYGAGFFEFQRSQEWLIHFSDLYLEAIQSGEKREEAERYYKDIQFLLDNSMVEYGQLAEDFLALKKLFQNLRIISIAGRSIVEEEFLLKGKLNALNEKYYRLKQQEEGDDSGGDWSSRREMVKFFRSQINKHMNTLLLLDEHNMMMGVRGKELRDRIDQEAQLSRGKTQSTETLEKGEEKRQKISLSFPLSFLYDPLLL